MQTPLVDAASLSRVVNVVDLLAVVVLLGREIYITASVLGACTYVAASDPGVGRQMAMVAGFVVAFGVRGLAMRYGWSLPAFRQSTPWGRWKREPKS